METKISVLILTQNSAKTLPRTLESVKNFDDIVVIDGGSKDDTESIAKSYHARFIHHPFEGFSPQRNKALQEAKYDWCLFVDSDEYVTSELKNELYRIVDSSTPYVLFKVFRTEYILGEEIKYGHGRSGYQERFLRKSHVHYQGEVHEYPVINGKKPEANSPLLGIINKDFRLLHNPAVSMNEFVMKVGNYSILRAKEKMGHKRSVNALEVIVTFPLTLLQIGFKSMKAGKRGLMAAIMEAVHRTLVKLLLYEETHFKKEKKKFLITKSK